MAALELALNTHVSRGAGGPGPTQPTLIPTGFAKPVAFADLAALARHIHRQRAGRGLRIAITHASYGGSDTFPAFAIYWLPKDGEEEGHGEDYAFTVAIQTDKRERLEAALAAANPDLPEAA
jgi:hypothetical protein